MSQGFPHQSRAVTLWILVSAMLVAGGWVLSALHCLHATGYAVLFILAGLLGWMCCGRIAWPRSWCGSRLRRRFRRRLPAGFLLLAALIFLGGLLYFPANGDAMSYRLPRVLYWLARGHWYWIPNASGLINTRLPGAEWLMAPWLAFFGTDRGLFLINFLPWLLMPGLVFSVFTRLGVTPRVAWSWMWVLPTGYVFVLQVGSLGNDAFAAIYALAMMDFALRARVSRCACDVWWALLSGALLTGVKLSNLPLLLPGLIAIAPSMRLLLPRPMASILVLVWALAVSFLPMAVLSHRHCGDWSGAAVAAPGQDRTDPVNSLVGNSIYLVTQNLAPPFFPWTSACACWLDSRVPAWLNDRVRHAFGDPLQLCPPEMTQEENAALGFGVSLLVLITVLVAGGYWPPRRRPTESTVLQCGQRAVRWSVYLALLVYGLKMGTSGTGRLVAPYYALLLPALLASPQVGRIVRQSWWRTMALLVIVLAIMLVVLTPSRPLWPARKVTNWLSEHYPAHRLIARARTVQAVYGTRWDALAPVRTILPAEACEVGFVSFTSSAFEASLWRPFGSRRFVPLARNATPSSVQTAGLRYVICGVDAPGTWAYRGFPDWRATWLESPAVQILGTTNLQLRATGPPTTWYVLQLP